MGTKLLRRTRCECLCLHVTRFFVKIFRLRFHLSSAVVDEWSSNRVRMEVDHSIPRRVLSALHHILLVAVEWVGVGASSCPPPSLLCSCCDCRPCWNLVGDSHRTCDNWSKSRPSACRHCIPGVTVTISVVTAASLMDPVLQTETNATVTPREIPSFTQWSQLHRRLLRPWVQALIGGVLGFGCVFIESFFIITTVWLVVASFEAICSWNFSR